MQMQYQNFSDFLGIWSSTFLTKYCEVMGILSAGFIYIQSLYWKLISFLFSQVRNDLAGLFK